MARLRIFVSSTCFDLGTIRSELRPFITSLGYEPVMSDFSDILYDPRSHTHDSCIKEVPSCDMVILIIGQRFGGTGIPSVLEGFDFDLLEKMSSRAKLLEHRDKLSITQLEILKAVEQSIPIYAFVDEKVMHDHHVYEKNKSKPAVMQEIEFPSIQKAETAKYIFEFINFISHRTHNNSLTPFSRLEDIREFLVNQWSQLFQRLVSESRRTSVEARRYADFSERLDDLKAVVMASIATPDLRETARGAIQYRQLITFLSGFDVDDHRAILNADVSWSELLSELKIAEIKEDELDRSSPFGDSYMIVEDGTFYRVRFPLRQIENIKVDWNNFCQLDHGTRAAIIDVALEDRETRRRPMVRYVNKPFEEYIEERRAQKESEASNDDS